MIILIFQETAKLFSKVTAPFNSPTSNTLVCVQRYLSVVLTQISLIINDVDNFLNIMANNGHLFISGKMSSNLLLIF